jgi:hypothetical protein
MAEMLYRDLVLYNVSRKIIDYNIFIFFERKLSEINNGFENLPFDWPSNDIIDLFVRKAGGLFIYVATVNRFIKNND